VVVELLMTFSQEDAELGIKVNPGAVLVMRTVCDGGTDPSMTYRKGKTIGDAAN
jgi:hypothetical protein